MTDTGAPPCSVCSSIPPDLLVNTGRDNHFPPQVGRLVRLGLDSNIDLWKCPSCDALFEWQNLPQYYGSGNNDEERLTRLDPAGTAAARMLLAPEQSAHDHEELRVHRVVGNLSFGLIYELLTRTAARHKEVFSTVWLGAAVRSYASGKGPAAVLYAMLDAYCGEDPVRIREVIASIDEASPASGSGAEYLREKLSERLAKTAVDRTSQQIAVELCALLTATCPSYAERRASPPAEPPYNMADYMHVCWDFAAHAVDMLQAGRSEELVPAFRAMAGFRDRSTEYWMAEGLAPVFERIWQEGEWRGVDVRALEHVIGPAFLPHWRRQEDPYDGDPYPIDGYY
jgi:hypothetical protein